MQSTILPEMPQIFHPSMNTISRVSIFGALFFLIGAVFLAAAVVRSPYITEVEVVHEQPVPFSHEHHVGEAGIDCRYCHQGVETSAFAGMPSTETCMNCHSHLFTDSPMLEPVRESYRTGEPIEWTRVHDLPDFVYFNHSIHVAKGVACVSCHGNVAKMPLMWRENTLHMQWCLDCHRDPSQHLRPVEEVYSTDWEPSRLDSQDLQQLMQEHDVQIKTSCYACHR